MVSNGGKVHHCEADFPCMTKWLQGLEDVFQRCEAGSVLCVGKVISKREEAGNPKIVFAKVLVLKKDCINIVSALFILLE